MSLDGLCGGSRGDCTPPASDSAELAAIVAAPRASAELERFYGFSIPYSTNVNRPQWSVKTTIVLRLGGRKGQEEIRIVGPGGRRANGAG